MVGGFGPKEGGFDCIQMSLRGFDMVGVPIMPWARLHDVCG